MKRCIHNLRIGDTGAGMGYRDVWVYCEYCGKEWGLRIAFDDDKMIVVNDGFMTGIVSKEDRKKD